jgi:O-antigen/teichoic acid export membrane protein
MLARYLGADGLGRYAFVTSVVFLANTLTTFGTDTLLIRKVSRARSGASPWPAAALILQLGLSGLLIALLILVAGSLPGASRESAAALGLYSLALIPLSFSTVFSAVLRGHERMDLYIAFTLVTSAIQALGGLLVLSLGGELPAIVVLLIAAHAAGAFAAAIAVRTLRPDFRLAWRTAGAGKGLLVEGHPPRPDSSLILYQRLGLFTLILLRSSAGFFAARRLIDARIVPCSLGGLFLSPGLSWW